MDKRRPGRVGQGDRQALLHQRPSGDPPLGLGVKIPHGIGHLGVETAESQAAV